jgi:redox-sensitive bicupin YhaK (pirin superfamily)
MVIEGAGVRLRRAIAPKVTNEFDPFLLFDHAAFDDPLEGPIAGFPFHPHRGIETVSYILQGFVHHRDSLGNAGLIGPGDAQWMTSGSGIMHEEMPRRDAQGAASGFQLWVNLPAELKMTTPRYQDVPSGLIPAVQANGATVRVVAGEFNGVPGPVTDIAAAPAYMDVRLEAGASFALAVPRGHTALAYVFEGAAQVGADETPVEAVRLVVFGDGDEVGLTSETGARFLLLAGKPFGETIVPYGPFVMNTVEEIQTALRELRGGTFVKVGAVT